MTASAGASCAHVAQVLTSKKGLGSICDDPGSDVSIANCSFVFAAGAPAKLVFDFSRLPLLRCVCAGKQGNKSISFFSAYPSIS